MTLSPFWYYNRFIYEGVIHVEHFIVSEGENNEQQSN